MNAIADKKIRFSDAVYAIETTPKSLRKWLQNSKFSLVSAQNEGEWKSFSFADIVCLAIMRKLVDFCVGVDEANDVSLKVVRGSIGPLLRSKNMPPQALSAGFTGRKLLVWKVHEHFGFAVHSPPESIPKMDAMLVIDLHNVVRRAIDRAIEIVSAGDVDAAN